MIWAPLIERELRVLVRQHNGGAGVKLACAAVATAAAFGVLFFWSTLRPGTSMGGAFLQLIALLGYAAALMTGTMLGADSISREKREGTFDLLVLTDLHVGDVVLGKLASKLVLPVYGLLAALPLLQISTLVGGTNAAECIRLLLMWINTLLFALAASLMASAFVVEQRQAYATAVLLIVGFTVGLPAVGMALFRLAPALGAWLWVVLSPSGPYRFAPSSPSGTTAFWAGLLGNATLTAAMLGLTSWRLARYAEQSPRSVSSPQPGQPATSHPQRAAGTRELLDRAPLEWLAARTSGTGGPLLAWTLFASVLVLFFRIAPFGTAHSWLALVILSLMHLVLRLAAAMDAIHAFGADRRTGALESLLGAPLKPVDMAAAVLRLARERYLVCVIMAAGLTVWSGLQLFVSGNPDLGLILVVAGALLPVDWYALFWVGLFEGLAARTAAAALGLTLLQLVFMPWAWLAATRGVFWRSSGPELVVLWTLVALGNQVWWLRSAKTRFNRFFRTLALKPFGGKNPAMESEWSPINWEADEEPEPTLT